MINNPFSLQAEDTYQRWREAKLKDYPASADALVVEVRDPRCLTETERAALLASLHKTNMAVYASRTPDTEDKAIPRELATAFGLARLDSNLLADEDSITSITVRPEKGGRGYIPYTNHRLLWHTDGYYNPAAQQIRAFVLHCVHPAAEGGENALYDPELLYIRLRDENPAWVAALMVEDVMTIPANEEVGGDARPAVTGPVFSVDAGDGSLHLRYTARTRSIQWKPDADTAGAVARIESLLSGDDTPGLFRVTLQAGQGLLSNNVLHNRTGFTDRPAGPARLMYRARYFDRIRGTGLREIHPSC
jgi:hypothetical protein